MVGLSPGFVVDGDTMGVCVFGPKPGDVVNGDIPGVWVDGTFVLCSFAQNFKSVIAPSPTKNRQTRLTFFISINTC